MPICHYHMYTLDTKSAVVPPHLLLVWFQPCHFYSPSKYMFPSLLHTMWTPPPPIQHPPLPLATCILIPLDAWVNPLWHNIWPHAHMDTLWHGMLNCKTIWLVSDVAVSLIGQGMCAWVIWVTNDLWSGKGYVPGPAIDMYAGLAKTYGLYTLLHFFHQYLCLFPLTIKQPQPIHIDCNNKGVGQSAHQMALPHDTICNDFPIFEEIQHYVHQMQPFSFVFHHVQCHQDKQCDQWLTIPECLNIDCDACAAKMPLPPKDLNLVWHPCIQAGFLHLCLNKEVVIQQLQHTLWDVAMHDTYFDYLTTKFNWTIDPVQAIQWQWQLLHRFESSSTMCIKWFCLH